MARPLSNSNCTSTAVSLDLSSMEVHIFLILDSTSAEVRVFAIVALDFVSYTKRLTVQYSIAHNRHDISFR